MSKFFICLILLFSLSIPTSALEITAPEVPQAGKAWMPEETNSFSDALWELLTNVFREIHPELSDAYSVCVSVVASVLLVALVQPFLSDLRFVTDLVGTIVISSLLLTNTNSMIHLGANTIQEISDYGKLLYPVMTTAMAAQGAMTASAAIYLGTAILDAVLSALISSVLVPAVYLYLALCISSRAMDDMFLKKMADIVRGVSIWLLKTLMIVFTTYLSITGIVSGTTDAAALKATKVTISSVVPVVGGILSDASEAVLVSAGVMKNAAGVYGILVILSLFLAPFLKIGIHYIMLKITSAGCTAFGSKRMTCLIEDFALAMGQILAMTSVVSLLLLISTICFMKGTV